uniref:Putative Mitogen-activated protein kinase kinase kinase n=1 Tax=Daphnia magna TaxID=35525 RepID=A0A0P5XEN5_9CRUS
MAHAMDLNSNNVTPELTPPAALLESRNAPSAIHVVRNVGPANNVNLQMGHRPPAGGSNPLPSASLPPPIQTQVCSSPAGPSGQQHLDVVTTAAHDLAESRNGWLDGIFGCFRPVFWNFTAKTNKDEWEIPFESLRDLEWLASGAQGVVYKARMRNEVVAVKKVKDKAEANIRDIRQLHHPNIIHFKGVCTRAPPYCLVMEYCPNGTLYNFLRSDNNTLSPRLTVDWAVQIASGMHYLHQNKIIHRDLKSPNVLLADNNVVKISDFGTCRTWNQISVEMSFIGTYAWMAPEVIRKELCSEKMDVWSYGVVLWELLTCESPYRDIDQAAIIFGVGNSTLHLPLPPTGPAGFLLLMRMCWDPKPRNRPSFSSILLHLSIASADLVNQDPEHYAMQQLEWKKEVRSRPSYVAKTGSATSSTYSSRNHRRAPLSSSSDSLNDNYNPNNNNNGNQQTRYQFAESGFDGSHDPFVRQEAEIKHVNDIRALYEEKLERVNNLFAEVATLKAMLEEQAKNRPKRKKPSKRNYKTYLVRPIQERLAGAKKSYSTTGDTGIRPRSEVFLEVEEDSGQPVTVLRPLPGMSCQDTPQLVNYGKRRSCRVKVLSHSQSLHRRSWSVGGSNVHQTMMRRSESHLRRLEHVSEKTSITPTTQQKSSRPGSSASSSSSRSSSNRRNSAALVDAGTQTIIEDRHDPLTENSYITPSGSRRSKGDGLESPALIRHRRSQQQQTTHQESSETEPVEEIEEETYKWERKRGRASGSSQHLSLCETSSQSINDPRQTSFGIGRRYTVDMSQYKYNDAWNKRVQQPAAFDGTHPPFSQGKACTLPARMNALNLSRHSSWETCSEQEDNSLPATQNVTFDPTLRRRSLGRNPIRSRKSFKDRPTSVYSVKSSDSVEENPSSVPVGGAGELSDVGFYYDLDGNVQSDENEKSMTFLDSCGNIAATSSSNNANSSCLDLATSDQSFA